jgi:hypothetical protein
MPQRAKSCQIASSNRSSPAVSGHIALMLGSKCAPPLRAPFISSNYPPISYRYRDIALNVKRPGECRAARSEGRLKLQRAITRQPFVRSMRSKKTPTPLDKQIICSRPTIHLSPKTTELETKNSENCAQTGNCRGNHANGRNSKTAITPQPIVAKTRANY